MKHGQDIHYAQRLAEDTKFPDGYFDVVGTCLLFHEVSAEAAKKIGSGGVGKVIVGEFAAIQDVVDQNQPRLGPVTHGNRHGSIQLDHGRRRGFGDSTRVRRSPPMSLLGRFGL